MKLSYLKQCVMQLEEL